MWMRIRIHSRGRYACFTIYENETVTLPNEQNASDTPATESNSSSTSKSDPVQVNLENQTQNTTNKKYFIIIKKLRTVLMNPLALDQLMAQTLRNVEMSVFPTERNCDFKIHFRNKKTQR